MEAIAYGNECKELITNFIFMLLMYTLHMLLRHVKQLTVPRASACETTASTLAPWIHAGIHWGNRALIMDWGAEGEASVPHRGGYMSTLPASLVTTSKSLLVRLSLTTAYTPFLSNRTHLKKNHALFALLSLPTLASGDRW